MTKDVTITVIGIQTQSGEEEQIEVTSKGTYYKRAGKNFVIYDEYPEDEGFIVRNRITFTEDFYEITKNQIVNEENQGRISHMHFEKNKPYSTIYNTPYGEMFIYTETTEYLIAMEEDYIEAHISYQISVNDGPMDCARVIMKIYAV